MVSGAAKTLIGYQPAARIGDVLTCAAPDMVVEGAFDVLIEHQPAARIGDATAHGGVIAAGCPTVIIGTTAQVFPLATDAPFAEECPFKKAARERREREEVARREAEAQGKSEEGP